MAKIKKDGTFQGANSTADALHLLAQSIGKLKAEAITALTDSSAGDATPASGQVDYVAAFTNTANAATNLAGKATTETAIGKVKDAVTELVQKTNSFASRLGLDQFTDNSGGTTADGTIAALDQSVTAAATGALKTNTDAIFANLNKIFYNLTRKVNECAKACGVSELNISTTFTANVVMSDTIAVIATDTGTAASPGVSKAEMDAALVKMANNVAYIAAKLNELRTASAAAVVAG